MHNKKLKKRALLVIQHLIWKQQRKLNVIEDRLDNHKTIESKLIQTTIKKNIKKLNTLELIKHCVDVYEFPKKDIISGTE
tara:strand:+ start:7981 stop:8220 length:240 start_codon:yes stop_codon:yes gene_type:complete